MSQILNNIIKKEMYKIIAYLLISNLLIWNKLRKIKKSNQIRNKQIINK